MAIEEEDWWQVFTLNTVKNPKINIFAGKWQYEVQLGTCGIMQVGWCTVLCKFMAEMGVGDTTHSYAYDGQRKKKWNVAAQNYGETWFAGDIIGTVIDLNEGTIEFYRFVF